MGIFDNETTSESHLEVAPWMRDLAPAMAGELRGLIGQDFLSPEELVAQFNPAQLAGINQLISSGPGTQALGNAMTQAGMGGLDNLQFGQDAIRSALAGGPAQNMGVDMGQVGQYINNDILNGQIQAALRDPYRALTEQQLPGARLSAAASGNTGSTRRGVGEAILQRGYEDRAADVGAMMRGNAYGQALGIGANQAAQNASLDQAFNQTQLGAGGQFGNLASTGANFLNMGNALNLQGIGSILQGGGMLQGQDQRMLDAGLQGFMWPYQQMQMLNPMVNNMAQTYGTQVNTQTDSMGIGNTILGGGLGLAGAALQGGMNPFSFLTGMFGGGGGIPMMPYTFGPQGGSGMYGGDRFYW